MRCNTGIDPKYLADQHLIAEQVELLMITGMLKRNNYQHKTPIPPKFKLGTGHMTFWVNKLLYLQRRLAAVKNEVNARGFKVMESEIVLDGFPTKYINDWQPSLADSIIVRKRIIEKMDRKPLGFWRHNRNKLSAPSVIDTFKSQLLSSTLFHV
jgi:deoxyribonuclease (pyrimidine dimer)